MRHGIWFHGLSKKERRIINLTFLCLGRPEVEFWGISYWGEYELTNVLRSGLFFKLDLDGRNIVDQRASPALSRENGKKQSSVKDQSYRRLLLGPHIVR